MIHTYVDKAFRKDALALIMGADIILREYAEQGYDMTLRQLYYQFVARDWLANTERNYKRLGKIVSDARLAGMLPWDVMVDRTRELREVSHWDSPEDIVRACATQYRIDTRADQPIYVEVWVEKDALAAIVFDACEDLDVHCLVCRGFVSQSAMWQAAQRLADHPKQERVILYLGDHDPSGLDMVRDIRERIVYTFDVAVRVFHVALTLEQVETYHCPSNPAKVTDSRYEGYRAQYGDHSWELDALEPKVLTELIVDQVKAQTDMQARAKLIRRQERERRRLAELADFLRK